MELSDKDWRRITWLITILLIIGSTFAGVKFPNIPAPPAAMVEMGTTNFDDLSVDNLTASDDVTAGDDITASDDITATDDLVVGDDATVSDDLSVTGDATVGALLLPSFANLTVTDSYILTPTYTIYSLDTASAVTITLAALASEGQPLVLVNDDANALIIADTNLASSDGGVITLADADDWIIFFYQDDKWCELAKSADS